MNTIYQLIIIQIGTDNAPPIMGESAALWVAEILPWLVPRLWLHIRVNMCLFLQQDHHMV